MKYLLASMSLIAALVVSGGAQAGSDDAKWVAKCVADNSDAKVSVEIVTKYCICMNDKMDDNESQSISNWEKSHPAEMKACEKVAGWK